MRTGVGDQALVLVLVLVVTGCCHRAGLAGTEGT
jgi:hypothetical protein